MHLIPELRYRELSGLHNILILYMTRKQHTELEVAQTAHTSTNRE